MLKQTEGSHAVAEAVALCRPQVICAYPITSQTHSAPTNLANNKGCGLSIHR